MTKVRKAHPPLNVKHEICDRIQRIADARGLGAYDIARKADMPISTVYAVIWGPTINPRFGTIVRIVDALDAAWMTIVEQRDRSAEILPLSQRRTRQ